MMDYNDLEYDILKVEEKEVGKRLDQFLANEYPDLSRSFLQTHIKEGYVLVNQHNEKNAYKVCFNDEIVIYFKKEEALDVKAENIPIDIIYEDDDVAVINKAANMVVHPSAGHPNHTLVNALLYHLKNLSTINGVFRPGIVHRLVRRGSGPGLLQHDRHRRAGARPASGHSDSPQQQASVRAPQGRSVLIPHFQAIPAGPGRVLRQAGESARG